MVRLFSGLTYKYTSVGQICGEGLSKVHLRLRFFLFLPAPAAIYAGYCAKRWWHLWVPPTLSILPCRAYMIQHGKLCDSSSKVKWWSDAHPHVLLQLPFNGYSWVSKFVSETLICEIISITNLQFPMSMLRDITVYTVTGSSPRSWNTFPPRVLLKTP